MNFYRKHLFFCTNQRDSAKKCCQGAGASDFCAYAKHVVRDKGWKGPGGVRVSSAGCMGRCSEGPALVIYPDAVWYTYASNADIDEILSEHVEHGRIVKRLLLD